MNEEYSVTEGARKCVEDYFRVSKEAQQSILDSPGSVGLKLNLVTQLAEKEIDFLNELNERLERIR
tara:strand:- start:139 stop:336 length:198 start_codon:yes stop_codon:yes gene_type:complete